MSTTFLDLLFVNEKDPRGKIESALAERGLLGHLAGTAGGGLRVASGVIALLEMPIGDFIFTAYRKHRLIEAARRDTLAAAGSRQVVQLLEHTIESVQHPTVDLVVDGASQTLFKLDLKAELTVEIATLIVEKGEIVDTRPGKATGAVSLGLSGKEILRSSISQIDLGSPTESRPTVDLTVVGEKVESR